MGSSIITDGLTLVEETEKSGDEIVDGVKEEFQQEQGPESQDQAALQEARATAQEVREQEAAEQSAQLEHYEEHEMEQ